MDATYQAALLRVSMELRLKRSTSIAEATNKIAKHMNLDHTRLQSYIAHNFNQFMAVSQHDLAQEKIY